MKIESVRELKQSLPQLLRKSFAPTARAARSLDVVSAHAMRSATRKPVLALGVAHARGQYRLAVRLQRHGLIDSPLVDAIKKHARGEVDVRYVGRIRALAGASSWFRKRQRPLLIGTSCGTVSSEFIVAGTLGCFVAKKNSEKPLILSNNHVLADENSYPKGGPIVQPGTLDAGKNPKDRVAKLQSFVKLKPLPSANRVDCAVAALEAGIDFEPSKLKGLGTLAGQRTTPVDVGETVHKIGRTTGLRHGRVTAIELDGVDVEYDVGVCSFDDQIEIEGAGKTAFSDAGDSGSLIVDEDLTGVALLFAGGDHGGSNGKGLTYANPLGAVLKALGVHLLF